VKMNKKILALTIIVGCLLISATIFISCAEVTPTAIEGETRTYDYDPGSNPAGFFDMTIAPSGGPFDRPPGTALVDHDTIESRITCEFSTRIDTLTLATAFTLEDTSGTEVDLNFAWAIGANSLININPAADLDHNTTYILSLEASALRNEAGDMLDMDGDEIGGETPDDDRTYRFTTIQADSTTPGVVMPQTDDVLAPVVVGDPLFIVDNDTVLVKYLDVSVALKIVDRYYDDNGGILRRELSASEFTSSTVILREYNSKSPVTGVITYADSTLMFNPAANLDAGTQYELVLKAQQITDDAGNKLSRTGDLSYSFTTYDRTYDGSIIIDDITPPTVADTDPFSDRFAIDFSEEIDPTSINAATIVVTYNGRPNPGGLVISRYVRGSSPTGFATTVTFYPNNPDWHGTQVVVKASIKDLAGNRKGSDSSYSWQ
jgi:hypothetical protein